MCLRFQPCTHPPPSYVERSTQPQRQGLKWLVIDFYHGTEQFYRLLSERGVKTMIDLRSQKTQMIRILIVGTFNLARSSTNIQPEHAGSRYPRFECPYSCVQLRLGTRLDARSLHQWEIEVREIQFDAFEWHLYLFIWYWWFLIKGFLVSSFELSFFLSKVQEWRQMREWSHLLTIVVDNTIFWRKNIRDKCLLI